MTPVPAQHYEGQDLEALADLPRYQGWVLDSFQPRLRGRVLEVGAGIGNFAARYTAQVNEAVLVEPAANLAATLSRRFAGLPNVRTVSARLEDLQGQVVPGGDFSDASFDACVMVNVLEHIEDDLAILKRIRQLLRPDGALLLFVPALPVLYGSLDALVDHHRRYLKASLRTVVERAGFRVLKLHYFDVLGVLPWFVAGRVLRRRRFDEAAARAYDRWFVSLGQRIERNWEPPFGKNLLCVAEPL